MTEDCAQVIVCDCATAERLMITATEIEKKDQQECEEVPAEPHGVAHITMDRRQDVGSSLSECIGNFDCDKATISDVLGTRGSQVCC